MQRNENKVEEDSGTVEPSRSNSGVVETISTLVGTDSKGATKRMSVISMETINQAYDADVEMEDDDVDEGSLMKHAQVEATTNDQLTKTTKSANFESQSTEINNDINLVNDASEKDVEVEKVEMPSNNAITVNDIKVGVVNETEMRRVTRSANTEPEKISGQGIQPLHDNKVTEVEEFKRLTRSCSTAKVDEPSSQANIDKLHQHQPRTRSHKTNVDSSQSEDDNHVKAKQTDTCDITAKGATLPRVKLTCPSTDMVKIL